MTAIAKLLVFLTLIAGVGAAVFAAAVYTQRPGWFEDVPDGTAPRGHVVMNFKGLARETDAQGKAGAAASALWGQRLRDLRAAEVVRIERQRSYSKLLADARTADTGFFEFEEDESGRLNVATPGKAVKGPDGKNLSGADTLEARIAASIDRVVNVLEPKIAAHRTAQQKLQVQILDVQGKLTRQRTLREDLQNEASYLGAARVNVSEQKDTAQRRLDQLAARLAVFGIK
ncbi:MAG TPA: hypothetical protein VD866_07970 [Urbifossiella sp.]|nr:hypothetical protein [Urbifossiella sp.]